MPETTIIRTTSKRSTRGRAAASTAPIVSVPERLNGGRTEHSFVDLGDSTRVAIMVGPHGRGSVREQALETLKALTAALGAYDQPLRVTTQTVYLRDPEVQAEFERVLGEFYGAEWPVTNFVLQPPCCGAALALEAWAIGGPDVHIHKYSQNCLSVSYDSVRWVYCAGITPASASALVYEQTTSGLTQMAGALQQAGSSYSHVVRTWFYLGGITDSEGRAQRYKELNRARTDFYKDIEFYKPWLGPKASNRIYPASTGIGAVGKGLVVSCVALETTRKDVLLLPLENPQQTPAYAYHPRYSPKSPKFSRAVALIMGDYVTTWVSGTASIVNSESRYTGDIEKQTEQTIDNIEKLIARENFGAHGISGAGATLRDLAKVRVYLKRTEDVVKCQAVCQRRFGAVPTLYAEADVCRPELLVEIEAIAFSPYAPRPD